MYDTINGRPIKKTKILDSHEPYNKKSEPVEPTYHQGPDWGTVEINGVKTPVSALLGGWEGRVVPAEIKIAVLLLREYKKNYSEYEGEKDKFAELVRELERTKQWLNDTHDSMASIEEALDKLLAPEQINLLLTKGRVLKDEGK